MKTLPLLTSALSLLLSDVPAFAWQNGQPADLVLGARPALGRIRDARGFALDSVSGKLFVSDYASGRVLRFASATKYLTGAPAEAVLGKPSLSAEVNLSLTAANLLSPIGLALDNPGHLWVGDSNRILRWNNATTVLSGTAADSVFGGADFTSVYPAGDANRLGTTLHLAVDAPGNLYVSSSDRNSILRFDAAAAKANGAAADVIFGQTSFTTTGAGLSAARVFGPGDVVVRGTTLFVHDVSNRRVLRLNDAATRATGASFDAVLGQDSFFSNTSQTLAGGTAMAISQGGNLFVAAAGPVIIAWSAVDTLSGLLPAPLYTTPYFSSQPFKALLPESETRLWTGAVEADNFYADSVPVRRLENLPSQLAPVSTLGAPPQSALYSPWQVAVDPVSGKVFVSDPVAHRVLRYPNIATLASHGPPEAFFGNSTITTAGGLSYPHGICVDSGGRLWVADTGHNRVLRWNNAATVPSGSPANGVLGQSSFNSNGTSSPPNETTLNEPFGVTVDAGGTLWVLDLLLARALRFDDAALKSGLVPADGLLGKPDFSTASSSGSPGRFHRPERLQFDAAGRLWIMDNGGVDEATGTQGNQIRIFRYEDPNHKAPGAMPEATIKFVFTHPGDAAHSFAVTPDNTLWVAVEPAAPRIYRYDNALSVVTGTVPSGQLGTGATGFDARTFGGALAAMSTDPAGSLWVADPVNRRVMRFQSNPPASAPLPGNIVSVSSTPQRFTFNFTAVPNSIYLMETSPDLLQWTASAVLQAVTPVDSFTDPAPSGSRRFYRARLME